MKEFEPKIVKDEIIGWIREFFDKNGKDCNAVVGISGGVDSSVVAALCVKALGEKRVRGLLMPCGKQEDITYSYFLCGQLGIHFDVMNIFDAVDAINCQFPSDLEISKQTEINLPARIRMATLYAYAQSINGRVANTCNLSEDWVGYSTRYGDSVGDFSPLANLTKTEVKAVGYELGLASELIDKIPSDGLCGKTDEDNLGFTYEILDKYIRSGEIEDLKVKTQIDTLHEKNLFKLQLMPSFEYSSY